MSLPDYSQWLTPGRLAVEETYWSSPEMATWPHFVRGIEAIARNDVVTSIIEFGCGTGHVAKALPRAILYTGVDANAGCIELARLRNPDYDKWAFMQSDVRDFLKDDTIRCYGIACAFSFLKHFGLHEWDAVVKGILLNGRYGLFSMRIGPQDLDDGIEFPHVQVTLERMTDAVLRAGHRWFIREPLPWGEDLIYTCRT